MKWLLVTAILLCLAGVMSCEDIVIGENPIVEVGNVVYVFPMETDSAHVYLNDWGHQDITVYRYYEDGYTVEFWQEFGETLEKVVVTLPSGNVYTLLEVKSKGVDDIDYSCSFSWHGDDYKN